MRVKLLLTHDKGQRRINRMVEVVIRILAVYV